MQATFSSNYWNHIKPQLLRKYPVLSDFDLIYKQGELREMMHHIEIKLHLSEKELRKLIDKLE